ncbi:MAG: DUF5666 domain-containing protein, partial [Pseudomonadota bacterium]
MMFVKQYRPPRLGLMFLVFVLSGCGGGGDATISNIQPPDNTPPPATTKSIEGGGIISRFGAGFSSVTVNAKTFDTTSSSLTITIDGQAATLQELQVGDTVIVQATTDDDGVTSIATSIEGDSLIEGPISVGTLDQNAQTFQVL